MTTETKVKEYPILFTGEMVRAILDGRKTQTRRVMRYQPQPFVHVEYGDGMGWHLWWDVCVAGHGGDVTQEYKPIKCPYGQPGDHLWVRETFSQDDSDPLHPTGTYYRATHSVYDESVKWKPCIFMPRAASRITLEVTNVDVERLGAMTPEEAIAEGISHEKGVDPIVTFAKLWDSLNEKRGFSWQSNPWIWILRFRKV